METKELQTMKRQMRPILRKYGVRKAAIFGSYARGEARKRSDIDILVDTKPMGLFKFVGLQQDLEDRVGKKVDLVSYRGIHPYLRDRILKEQVIFYEA